MKRAIGAAIIIIVGLVSWRIHSENSENATSKHRSSADSDAKSKSAGEGVGPLRGDTNMKDGSSSFSKLKNEAHGGNSEDAAVYGTDRAGRRISELMELTRLVNERGPAAESQHRSFLESIRRDPHGYADVRTVIERIQGNPAYQLQAAGLLEILADDPASRDIAHSIAEKQMRDVLPAEVPLPMDAETEEELNKSLSTDETMLPPIIAYEVFLKTAHNEQEAYDGTLRVVSEQPNHNVRTSMIVTFSEKYPERKDDLLNTLKANGVRLVDMNQQPESHQ